MSTALRLVDVTDVVEPSVPDPGSLEFVFIDLGSVDAVTKLVAFPKRILVSAAPARARQRLRSGDVLVSTVRPGLNGVASVSPPLEGAMASTAFSVLRPRPELVDDRYLFHWVQAPSFVAEMTRLATGGGTPVVSDLQVRASSIPVPPLPDQRRMAAVLDQSDQLRHERRSAIALLDELVDALLLDLLESTERVGRLGDLIESATPGSPVKSGAEVAVPLIRGSNILEGELDLPGLGVPDRDVHGLDPADPDSAELNRFLVRNGDVLFCRTGSATTLAKAAVFRGDAAAYGAPLLRLRPLVADAGDFLAAYLNGAQGKTSLRSLGSITAKSLVSMPTPIPTASALTEFSGRLHDIRLARASERLQSARLDELQTSLQFRAFNGRL
ncbi:restriction endonuclease subunit S [Lacisediminihabitans sp.]|jgi:type I restriction enzyme S subunit|uniref:restriction endonuclease subunit S n=1 Tax=Lacisediminihabitans sp. TaxID=2787631 RepID=UPI002F92875D